jgi:hypothetical protein
MLVTTDSVTIERTAGTGDPYESATVTTIATATPARISAPSGDDLVVGGAKEVVDAVLYLDPAPVLAFGDIVVDEATDERYRVAWVRQRRGLGLDHQHAGLTAVKGGAVG